MPDEALSSSRPSPASIPRDGAIDATIPILRQGYRFIPNRCDRLRTDVFRTRLMLSDVVCMRGPEAARLFYGEPGLTRKGSMPQTVLRLLQDKGSVQQLDGDAHLHRKALFVSMLMRAEGVAILTRFFRDSWRARMPEWQRRRRIVLFEEVNAILTEAVCRWVGLPAGAEETSKMTRELSGMVENAGHIRTATFVALLRRNRTEAYLENIVERVRSGDLEPPPETPLALVAAHEQPDGSLVEAKVAAIELLNILRPVVAIGRFVTFSALELHRDRRWHQLISAGDEHLEDFVEEVRRISPFFPFVGAKTGREIEWRGHTFPAGQWLLLDLYGTTHDARLFPQPHVFSPERKLSWRHQDYRFITQGAGRTEATHHCPGERITVEIMKEAVRLLCREMHYRVPEQDFSVKMNRIPALPESGFVMEDVRAGEPP